MEQGHWNRRLIAITSALFYSRCMDGIVNSPGIVVHELFITEAM